MRKIIAFMMVLAVFLSLSISVFADDDIVWAELEPGQEWLCEEHHVIYNSMYPDAVCPVCADDGLEESIFSSKSFKYSPLKSSGLLGATGDEPFWDILSFANKIYSTSSGNAQMSQSNDFWLCSGAGLDGNYNYISFQFYGSKGSLPSSASNPVSALIYVRFKPIYNGQSQDLSFLSQQYVDYISYYLGDDDSGSLATRCDIVDSYVDSYGYVNLFVHYEARYPDEDIVFGTSSSQGVKLRIFTTMVPVDIQLSDFKFFYNHSDSTTLPGNGITPPTPPDPPGPTPPPTDSDAWSDEMMGTAIEESPINEVLTEKSEKLDTIDEFETDVFAQLDEYQQDIGVEDFIFPTFAASGALFLSNIFNSFFGELELSGLAPLITFPLLLGLASFLIGNMGMIVGRTQGREHSKKGKGD